MRRGVAILGFVAVAACAQDGLRDELEPPELDQDFYRCFVQPVVAARCAFMECHGSARRPYHTFAVQRMRLDVPWTELNAPITERELRANYLAAIGFAGGDGDQPQLLLKPLDVEVGGYHHEGKYLYGNEDVFTSEDDRGYQILREWIDGAAAEPSCEPTQEVGL